MVGSIPPGSRDRVILAQPTQCGDRAVQETPEKSLGQAIEIGREKVDQIVEAALLDRQRSVDVRLRQIETWPDKKFPV